MARRGRLDGVLTVLAGAYLAAVVALTVVERSGRIGLSGFEASAERLADGELPWMVTSALVVEGPLPSLQIGVTAAAVAGVIRREGAVTWWGSALCGHVGSALIAYGAMGIGALLGSEGAEAALEEPDYGVSCVFGGSMGALFASGVIRRDPTAAGLGVLGFVGLLPFSLGWHGIEHPLSFALGAGFAAWRIHGSVRGRPRQPLPHGR